MKVWAIGGNGNAAWLFYCLHSAPIRLIWFISVAKNRQRIPQDRVGLQREAEPLEQDKKQTSKKKERRRRIEKGMTSCSVGGGGGGKGTSRWRTTPSVTTLRRQCSRRQWKYVGSAANKTQLINWLVALVARKRRRLLLVRLDPAPRIHQETLSVLKRILKDRWWRQGIPQHLSKLLSDDRHFLNLPKNPWKSLNTTWTISENPSHNPKGSFKKEKKKKEKRKKKRNKTLTRRCKRQPPRLKPFGNAAVNLIKIPS